MNNPWKGLLELIVQLLVKTTSIDSDIIRKHIEIPPESNFGDVASTIAFWIVKENNKIVDNNDRK